MRQNDANSLLCNFLTFIQSAHSAVSEERENTIGKLLHRLKPGMTREEIEAWMGLPFDSIDGAIIGEYDTIM